MSSNKDQKLKEFLISERKTTGTGYTSAPVWAMQKKGDRIWNTHQKRHWSNVGLGKKFRKNEKREQ
jgi:ribosomal protein L39E